MKALIVFALFDGLALVLATLWFWRAPEGYEDEAGFHVTGPSRWERWRQRLMPAPVRVITPWGRRELS